MGTWSFLAISCEETPKGLKRKLQFAFFFWYENGIWATRTGKLWMKPLDMKTAFTLDPPNTSSPTPPTHAPSKTLHNGCEGYWGNGETKQLENEGLPSPLPLLNLVNVPPPPWRKDGLILKLFITWRVGVTGIWYLSSINLSSRCLERKYMPVS